MEIRIRVSRDSDNSGDYPETELVIADYGDYSIALKLSDNSRTVWIAREELVKVLKVLMA